MYFHNDKFAIEIDENDHDDRDIEYEIKRQIEIEEKLDCEIIRTDHEKENFYIHKAINKIIRHIKQLSKKVLSIRLVTILKCFVSDFIRYFAVNKCELKIYLI